MRGDAQPGRLVQGARRDADHLAAGRVPEEARAAFAAEATPRAGIAAGALDPPQAALLGQYEIVTPRRGAGRDMAVPAPALLAMANEDIAQGPAHLVGDRATQAAPRRQLRHGSSA